ncbi:peptidase U32 family protein [Desulfovibrio litoralis]|uniref:peptidase U32 family protein n=1 Tax=Desulfovibrio litoralis TaxID=466107 RepID=UPI000933DFBD
MNSKPEILAPAGDTPAFLAAMAAGADAIYLGLKHFSARMQAQNFSLTELSRLTELAHSENRRVYIALNTLLKPSDPLPAGRLLARIARFSPECLPDALIIQDPGVGLIARQAGYSGELHFSTIANVTHTKALAIAQNMGASRVILPRELSIDEVKTVAAACPSDLELEFFVHGALCWCVSGRCWWSSYMGGKSGLRGRCVQPCRRVYKQKGKEGRFFSCFDLSLGPLTKTLLDIPQLSSWKIEGRKKGPHYVFYVVTAYKMLRDNPDDPQARKEAEAILSMALGRQTTKARFLPQGQLDPTRNPTHTQVGAEQTSSGLFCGRLKMEDDPSQTQFKKGKLKKGERPQDIKVARFILSPRFNLIPQDYLRIGYEDEPWHATQSVSKVLPKGGTLTFTIPRHKWPKNGTPVFLIDRKEPELMALLKDWNIKLDKFKGEAPEDVDFRLDMPSVARSEKRYEIYLQANIPQGKATRRALRSNSFMGLWLGPKPLQELSRTLFGRISWWLPPVIWPNEEDRWALLISNAIRSGARHFVCNSQWQRAFFPTGDAKPEGLSLSLGPFVNLANAFSLQSMADLGFERAVISPELAQEDVLSLPHQSPLPLGIVLSGFFPMGISRHTLDPLKAGELFASPKKEAFWSRRYGENTWIYPAWPLDLTEKRNELEKAGYSFFVHFEENIPKELEVQRTSSFNWDIELL